MGWWDGIRSLVGQQVKGIAQLNDRELAEIKRDMDLGIQKLERQLDKNEAEQHEAAKAVLTANSQARKIVAMERLKAVKSQGKMVAKAYVVRSRYRQGIENIITLKQAVGTISEGLSQKLQSLDPQAISDYLATLGDDFSRQTYDSDSIVTSLDELTADMGDLADKDEVRVIEELQDEVLTDANLSEEQKIKRLLEM